MEGDRMRYVSMTDHFMGGWGKSDGKINKLVISCSTQEEALVVKKNAKNRGDMNDIVVHKEEPIYPEDRFFVSWEGRKQGSYENWFTPGWFEASPKMTKTKLNDTKRGFLNIGRVFEKPTGALSEKLHSSAINERLIRFMTLRGSGLTAKQIEGFTFKLTDAEKLSILSRASHRAPLRREHAEEMERLFLKVYGKEAHRSIFRDGTPPEKPEWLEIWENK